MGSIESRISCACRRPLFTKDLNCRCFDPNTTFVLNPQVWTDPAPGQWGTAAPYYSDYRTRRRPQENFSVGRLFRITEKTSSSIRAEFTNVFNRTLIARAYFYERLGDTD